MQVLLIDAHNFLYRSHFAHAKLMDSRGRPTGILHGMLKGVLALGRYYPHAAQVFCWDTGKSWRYKYMENYKGVRTHPVDVSNAVSQQQPVVQSLLKGFGFKQIGVNALEADDVISLLAAAMRDDAAIEKVIIYSGDHDFYQCVGGKIIQVKHSKQKITEVTERSVMDEYGVYPHQFAWLRAIAGDKSDKFKPVPGVAEKKALDFLGAGADPRFPDFDQHPSVVRNRIMDLRHYWSQIHLFYRLSVLPAPDTPSDCLQEFKAASVSVLHDPSRTTYSPKNKQRARKLINDVFLRYDLMELDRQIDDFWRLI